MSNDLVPKQMLEFLSGDFEALWEAIALDSSTDISRGNFIFALMATILLEWASRLAGADPTTVALGRLSDALSSREPRYFTNLPGECPLPRFRLPTRGDPKHELLGLVFDLIRNGQAHQYQQKLMQLPTGEFFGIAISGPAFGNSLTKLRDGLRPPSHLSLLRDGRDGELGWLRVDPAMLFFDIRAAIEDSGRLKLGLNFPYLRPKSRHYQFSLENLREALVIPGSISEGVGG